MAAYGSTSPSDTMLQDKDASHASAQCSHSSAHRQGGDLWRQCAINMRMSVLKVPIVFLIILKLENAGKCWKMLENAGKCWRTRIHSSSIPIRFFWRQMCCHSLITKASCVAQNLGAAEGFGLRWLSPFRTHPAGIT